jgi:hypothetical protein
MSPSEKRSTEHETGQRPGPVKKRLDTQIHRRKKAPPVPPLEAEWDDLSASRSTNLKMPPDKMKPSPY